MPEFPKPQTVRSQRVIAEIRQAAEVCEYCQHRRPDEVHHIRSKGSGGADIRENLIALCGEHHRDAQEHRISPLDLFRITAVREGIPLTQVYQAVGLVLPNEAIEEAPPAPVTEMDQDENSWETDVSVFIQYQQERDDSGWKLAEHATRMRKKYGPNTASKLAAEVNLSAAYLRKLMDAANAFPEEKRDLGLQISHHIEAAQSDRPEYWLQQAAENNWSVREIRQAKKDVNDQRSEDEDLQVQMERLEQQVRKFNEKWETKRNIKAALAFEDAGFRIVKEAV